MKSREQIQGRIKQLREVLDANEGRPGDASICADRTRAMLIALRWVLREAD